MITKTVRQFTYEDVRLALEAYFDRPLAGVKLIQEYGFLVQECPRAQQPFSAPLAEAISIPGFHAVGDDDPLLPHDKGLTGEPERRGK